MFEAFVVQGVVLIELFGIRVACHHVAEHVLACPLFRIAKLPDHPFLHPIGQGVVGYQDGLPVASPAYYLDQLFRPVVFETCLCQDRTVLFFHRIRITGGQLCVRDT